MIELNKIYNMDCLKGMKLLEDESVDCIWTDPPYNINYKYDYYKDDLSSKKYWKLINSVILESHRLIKKGGCLYIKQFWRNQYETINLGLKNGFTIYNVIIWKNSSPAQPKTNYKPMYEVIIMFVKGDKINYFNDKFENRECLQSWDKKRMNKYYGKISNLWLDIPFIYAGSIKHKEGIYDIGTNKKSHPAQHPIKLVTRCIGFVTKEKDLIINPFIGSGTTAVACKQLGRNYIGFEISKEYCNIANKRLQQENLKEWFKNGE